jgi:protein-S-isoprenylcysteine O-methyltransferase Ste14
MKKPISLPAMILKFIIAIPIMMAILFWPAGTLRWTEAWIYIIIQLGYAVILTAYFWKRSPELIKARMETKLPPKLWDKLVMLPVILAMIALLIIPGFDLRYQWSSVPIYLEVMGFIGFILSLYLLFLVMKENAYLIKTIEVRKGQKTITTGPYKYIRHPMYAGSIIMVFSIALALGSIPTFIPAAITSIALIIRTYLEDNTLKKDLKGYKAYQKKTRYRLLPWVW